MELRILDIIAYEYNLIKYASMDITWKTIESYYYEIVCREIWELIKKYQVYTRKANNRLRGSLILIITQELFECIQMDLINFKNTPDSKFK